MTDLFAHRQSNLHVVGVAIVGVADCCDSNEVLIAAKASGVRLQTVLAGENSSDVTVIGRLTSEHSPEAAGVAAVRQS